MKHKITSILIACCFLNTALYAPVLAYDAYARPRAVQKSKYVYPQNINLPAMNQLAYKVQEYKKSDIKELVEEARKNVDYCILKISAFGKGRSIERNFLNKSLLTLNQRLATLEALGDQIAISADNGTQPLLSTIVEVTLCLAALTYSLYYYGFEESSPESAVAYDIYLVSYSLLITIIAINNTPTELRFLKTSTMLFTYTALAYFYVTALWDEQNDLIGLELIVRTLCYPLR